MKLLAYLSLALLISCGSQDSVNYRKSTELHVLKTQVLALQGTVALIDAFSENDFSDCSNALPPFESKICRIAQTATAEQRVIFASQLGDMAKIMQVSLYGEDCTSEAEAGCPVPGSITADIADLVASSDDLQNDIAAIQAEVLQLQADIAAINSRLNDFNGSGSSVETVISNLQSDLTAIESRVDAVEAVLDSNVVYKTIFLCSDNSTSGPVFEAILMSGDRQTITAYMQDGSKRGLGKLKEVSDSQGNLFLTTALNTRACNFKIYEASGELKVCWSKTSRTINQASLDSLCDSGNNFANPGANCTCE